MRRPTEGLGLAVALLAAAAPVLSAAGLASSGGLLAEARSRAGNLRPPRPAPAPRADAASEIADVLRSVSRLPAVSLECNGLPMCPGTVVYYEQASVDLRVSRALESVPELVRSGQFKRASDVLSGIRSAVRYTGEKLVPARVPLYPAIEVDRKVSAALALLPRP